MPASERAVALALAVLVGSAGCAGGDAPPAAAPVAAPDSARARPADSGAAPAATARLLAEWRARVPPAELVRPGACPFECCVYGEWIAESEIAVRAQPRRAAPVEFTVPPEQPLRADSGTLFITQIALVAVRDSVETWAGDGPFVFLPGDTLVLLEPLGEGHFELWHRGRVLASEGFWDPPNDTLRAPLIGQYAREWWVHTTLADGRRGWFLADSVDVYGADACGGPR